MIVVPKRTKFKRKKIKYHQTKTKKVDISKVFAGWRFWAIFIVVFLWFWIYVILQYTLYSPTNYITNIQYNPNSISQYNNPYLYKSIRELVEWKNFFLVKFFDYWSIKSKLESDFPILEDLEIIDTGPNSVSIDINFYQPDILIWFNDAKYWVFWNNIFPLYTGNTLWTWIFMVELPAYLSGIDTIRWLFYDIWANKFKEDLYKINDSFPQASRIVYLPWAMVTTVFVYDKQLYIHHDTDIDKQVQNFYLLEKYYDWIDWLYSIDLWSLDLDKVVVKEF